MNDPAYSGGGYLSIFAYMMRIWRRAEEALGGAVDTTVAVNRGILSLALSKHEVCVCVHARLRK